jgi:hypothetical protein
VWRCGTQQLIHEHFDAQRRMPVVNDDFVCFDRVLPDAALQPHAGLMIEPDGVPTRAAFQIRKLWPSGKRLRVRYMDGSQELRDQVQEVAAEWADDANIVFDFGDDEQAERTSLMTEVNGVLIHAGVLPLHELRPHQLNVASKLCPLHREREHEDPDACFASFIAPSAQPSQAGERGAGKPT